MRRKGKQLDKAQKTIVYERAQAKMWEDRAVAERAVFMERVRGEERRQRKLVVEVAAVEAVAFSRDCATTTKRVLKEVIEEARQKARQVAELAAEEMKLQAHAMKLQVTVAGEKMASICNETMEGLAVSVQKLLEGA